MGQVAQATSHERLAALRAAIVNFDDKAIAALNYANGSRTAGQIARLVAATWFERLAESGVANESLFPPQPGKG